MLKFRKQEETGADGSQDSGGGGDNTPTVEELQAQLAKQQESIAAQQAENERLQGKIKEANKHNKQAQKEAQEAAKKKAESDGNYEELFKSSEAERAKLQQQIDETTALATKREINNAALKVAGTLADGENIELLSTFIKNRLTFVEGDIKVTDSKGNLTVSTLEDLAKEFQGSSRYSSLIKGNQSSGGGATGGSGVSGTTKNLSREDFNKLEPSKQMEFCKSGGTIN